MRSKVVKRYLELLWVFLLGSFIGFIYENFLTILNGGWELRQGVIYGPLIPVYGVGLLAFYLLATRLKISKKTSKKDLLIIFLVASFLGGLVEYVFSFLQEKIWGTMSWNYDYMSLSINGRTSVPVAMVWGSAFIVFSLYILPYLEKHKYLLDKTLMIVLSVIVSVMLFFDCSISLAATYRQKERRDNIEPSNAVEVFLDKHYPDEYLDKIYNNAILVNEQK